MKTTALTCLSLILTAASLAWADCGQCGETQACDKEQTPVPEALNFTMNDIQGQPVALKCYRGKVVMMVNVASKCGLTPQYKALEALYEKYRDQGFVVLGFPANNFGSQEPGSNEVIARFCTEKYDVQFPMFSKVSVKGEDQCELYKHLTALDPGPAATGDITWNFEKFLLSRQGKVVARFTPKTKPDDEAVVKAIEEQLAQPVQSN